MDNAETDGQVDYESIRRRFPWVGHGPDEEHEFSKTYRDVLAGARVAREVVEAGETIRRSA